MIVNKIRKATTDDRLKSRCLSLIQLWQERFVKSHKSKQADGQSPTTSQLNQKSAGKSVRKASSLVSQTPVTTGGTPVDQTKSENRKRRKHPTTTRSPEDNAPPKKQQVTRSPKQATKEIRDRDRTKQPEEGASPDQRECSSAKGKSSSEGSKDSKSLHKQVVLSNANKAAGVANKTESQTRAKPSAKYAKSKKSPKGAAKHSTSGSGNSGRNGSASSLRQSIQYKEINQASRPLTPNRAIIPSPEFYHNNEDGPGSNSERETLPSLFDEEEEEEEEVDKTEGLKEEVQEGSLDELTMSSVPDSPVDSQESSSSQHSYESKFSEFGDDFRKVDKPQTAGDDSLRKAEVSEEAVDRLHNEHWEGMNGNFGSDGRWSSWDSCLVLDSGEGHSLHILPYVCID